MKSEHRTLGQELRMGDASSEKSIGLVGGYAALFDSRSELLGGYFFEIIKPGAFDNVLEDDVRALVDHDTSRIVGRSSAGNLKLEVDEKGLAYEIDLPDTAEARDLRTNIELGLIKESSFGFSVASGGSSWDMDDEGRTIRTITEIGKLYDVSPVGYPAYADTEVALRDYRSFEKDHKEELEARRAVEESDGPEEQSKAIRDLVELMDKRHGEMLELIGGLTKQQERSAKHLKTISTVLRTRA